MGKTPTFKTIVNVTKHCRLLFKYSQPSQSHSQKSLLHTTPREFSTLISRTPALNYQNQYFDCQLRKYGSDSSMKDVKFAYNFGLPVISVPLPSRQELCNFTLRPMCSTVGDFLSSLKQEDKGIDRVHIHSLDGCRIASSTLIEHLLKEKFILTINTNSFEVDPPPVDQLPSERVEPTHQVKTLIAHLYNQLHVDQHQFLKERELLERLENLKVEMKPLDELKTKIAEEAAKRTRALMWVGMAGMVTQFGLLARLTWWEYSWDVMEPVTYFVTYGTAILVYGYFVLTQQEYLYPDARDRQYLRFFYRAADRTTLDVNRYNKLCDEIAQAEQDLKRLRDPLQLQLPVEPIRIKEMERSDDP